MNVRKVEELMAAGRMRPPGLTEVEAAKADGRWTLPTPLPRRTPPSRPILPTPWRRAQ